MHGIDPRWLSWISKLVIESDVRWCWSMGVLACSEFGRRRGRDRGVADYCFNTRANPASARRLLPHPSAAAAAAAAVADGRLARPVYFSCTSFATAADGWGRRATNGVRQ